MFLILFGCKGTQKAVNGLSNLSHNAFYFRQNGTSVCLFVAFCCFGTTFERPLAVTIKS
jgi:hypothetical protein